MADPLDPPERQVRKRRIDPRLKALGWGIVPYSPALLLSGLDCVAIEEYPTDDGPADYALVVRGVILGIVEAKKLTLGPQNVLTQAERYSRGATGNPLDFGGFHVPFVYSTNGEVIWLHDVRQPLNRSRRVAGFHTPEALTELLARDFDSALRDLIALPNRHPRLRPYQIEANDAIEAAIVARKRLMLVAMATGTGKTFTMVNEVYRLLKSGVATRILFLVDRRALAAQAVRAFASHEPEPGRKFDQIYEVYSQRLQRGDSDDPTYDPKLMPESYLREARSSLAFVYVCTIQRLAINLFGRDAAIALGLDEPIDDDASPVEIPSHAFDFIIADECHRGYSTAELSVWRNTLDHFDAIKVGLTATPAAHTKVYFQDVVYRYEYDRAVREGFLVDYNVVAIKSDVRLNGVFLKAGEGVENVDSESGASQLDFLEDERQFDTTDVERRVTAPDSNRRILEEIKKYAVEHEARFGRFPKTLVFAVNDLPHTSHADQLVRQAREVFGQGDAFAQKITGRVDRPLQRIREFRNRPEPSLVVTVDMLSTGVDIPDLEFIVFLRPVKSRILFEQMLGRGTRLGERFRDKSHFTVFDCFDGSLLAYFRDATAITAEPPERESRSIREIVEAIWQNRDRDYNVRCLVKRLQRIDKEMSGDAHERLARFVDNGDLVAFAASLPRRVRAEFTITLTLLRDEDFQDLLVNYPRPRRGFVVAYGVEDRVGSQWLIRDGSGREYRPEDYLTTFARFVRENETQIDAIRILLERPRDWSTDALGELRDKLRAAPEGFTVERLQRAHEMHYQKALVDVISMVKHAANEQQELLTADERVRFAFARLTADRQFTDDQRQWLDRIQAGLIENLSLGRGDFDVLPILYNAGGWGRANRDFGGKLSTPKTIGRSPAAWWTAA